MAASILGVGFKTPLQLFEDIMEDRETEVNDAMRRGTMMEPIAREWLNQKYQSNLQPVVVQHPDSSHDWHISSLDGLWKRPDGSYFACEIKHPGKIDHEKALDGQIPEKYIPQCFHILEDLPGVDRILYLSYREESQVEIWLERNEHEMDMQFAQELSFYEKLLSCTPPEPTEKDWVEFLDYDLVSQAHLYGCIQDQIEELQAKSASIKEQLLQGTSFSSRAKIGQLKLQKVIRKGAIEYTKIDALKGIDMEQYRKNPIVSWRVSN